MKERFFIALLAWLSISIQLICARPVPDCIYGPEIDNWTAEVKQQQREKGKEFIAMLKEAATKGIKEINLKRGDYRFSTSFSDDPSRGHIILRELKDITVNANGSQFWFDDYQTALYFENCQGVTFRNLNIDYDPLPFTQGVITEIGDDYIDFVIEKGFLSPVEIRKKITSAESKSFIYNKNTRLVKAHVPHMTSDSFEEIGENRIRMKVSVYGGFKPNTLPIEPGDYVDAVFRHRTAIIMHNSVNLSLKNVNLYAGPHFGIMNTFCSGTELDNFNVIPRPGTKRLMSVNADAIHMNNSLKGPRIVNCSLSGMGDDGINVYTSFHDRVQKQTATNSALVLLNSSLDLTRGDSLNFYDGTSLIKKASVRILEIKEHVTPEATPQPSISRDRKAYLIKFSGAASLAEDDIVENLKIASRGTYIANNRIYNATTRGIIMKVKESVVENNFLEDVANSGILTFANLGSFKEGPFPSNVIIRNNTLIRTGYGGATRGSGYKKLGAICLNVEYAGPMKKEMYNTVNITVENNYIEDTVLPGIYVTHVNGALIRANTIKKYINSSKGRMGQVLGIEPFSAIYVAESRGVILEDNHISEPGINAEEEIRLGPNSGLKK